MSTNAGFSRGAELLAKWRGKLSQVEACKRLGLDPVTYNRFERGVRKPSALVSFEIEKATRGDVPARSWIEAPRKRAA